MTLEELDRLSIVPSFTRETPIAERREAWQLAGMFHGRARVKRACGYDLSDPAESAAFVAKHGPNTEREVEKMLRTLEPKPWRPPWHVRARNAVSAPWIWAVSRRPIRDWRRGRALVALGNHLPGVFDKARTPKIRRSPWRWLLSRRPLRTWRRRRAFRALGAALVGYFDGEGRP